MISVYREELKAGCVRVARRLAGWLSPRDKAKAGNSARSDSVHILL